MVKLWIARDKNGYLYAYNNKPIRDEEFNVFDTNYDFECEDTTFYNNCVELYAELFPEITWENSPQQVELKLIKNENKK